MSYDPKYIVDIFEDIVADVREQWDIQNRLAPYYLHGHPKAILKTLSQRDKSDQWKYRKYPLIALFQDIGETKGQNPMIEMTVSPRIIIADKTKREYDSDDRYDNEFKPILYPLYELLKDSMYHVGNFNVGYPDMIQDEKHDRLFWGSEGLGGNEQLLFNDYLDVIDITFTNLEILSYSSC